MKREGYLPYYKVIFSSVFERELWEGDFEIKYPENFPPTISSKHFKTRCSLLIGKPRLGGKLFFPRKELRIKVLPTYNLVEEDKGTIELNKMVFEPGEEVIAKGNFGNIKGNISTGILIEEWYKRGLEEYRMESIVSEGKLDEGKNKIVVKLPSDFSRVNDPFLFFPYSFTSFFEGGSYGIKAYFLIQQENQVMKKEIVIKPKKPVFKLKDG